MSSIYYTLCFEDLLVAEGPFQIDVHFHVAELGDNEIEMSDGL